MKRRMIAMTILVTMATSNMPVINVNADIRDMDTTTIEVEVNQEAAEAIEEDKSNLTEENVNNAENEDIIIEEDITLNEEDIIYNNSSNIENEIIEPNNTGILEESQIEISNEIDTVVKSNDEITDETKILENQQLVDELEGQTWLLEVVASSIYKDINEVTIKDLKEIKEISKSSIGIPENSVIPKIIGRFESLNTIEVYGNSSQLSLTDPLNTFKANGNLVSVSKEIGKCINLKEVKFSFNNLTYLPKELFSIKNITRLDLSSTALKRIDGIASEISNLTNLTYLDLSHTFIDINDVKSLGSLENLQILDISSNMILGDIKDVCDNIKVSKTLYMDINSFYGNGKHLLNYDKGITIYCNSNLIYFSDEDVVKFEQYNERENDKSYGYRSFRGNFFNSNFVKGDSNKRIYKISNVNENITVKKGTNIDQIYSLYKEGIRVLNSNLDVSYVSNKIFRENVPYKINIKNSELFDENGIAIKDGVAKIEIKYDDESVLWEDEFEVVPNITNLTINYVDKYGNEIADKDVIEGDYGTSYIVNPKVIQGYRVENINNTDLLDNYEYKFGKKNSVVTVFYSVFNELPVIAGSDYIEIEVGDEFDPIKDLNISASDYEDGDISESIEVVESNIDTTKEGEYEIILSAEDSEGQVSYFTATVKVNAKDVENPEEPVEPSEPVQPNEPEELNNSTTNNDKNQNTNSGNKPTNNKNQLPKTGGVSSSILLAIGALLVGAGKKKL
jgi:LPXTG-motif cell wall-anchored protein